MSNEVNIKDIPVVKKQFKGGILLVYIALSLWALTTMYPFFWVIINSFKQKGLIRSDSFSIPTGQAFTTSNFKTAFDRFNIFGAYKNSLLTTTAVTILVVIIAGLAGYAMARYSFKGKRIVHSLVVASMMFPAFSTVIPVFMMEFGWGIVNTSNVTFSLISVALPQIAGNLSFAIVVLMGFIKSVPQDLEEAAYIEGCSIFQIFFKVIVPVARPSFATVAIFTFLWSYNDMFTQNFFLRDKDAYTITLLLNEISSQAGVNYGLMCAGVVLIVVPILIVYIFLQKNIIKGMTAGAVKG